ncbi:MAG TPA: hypothetical protein PLL30_10090 [Candidatus Krumholzibacteria bacterium]|nr:hypothetical protein [Candidatus Krumholzibacteria bacterium]HPD72110.1 hypothetical protein [Candidatus Krumholzibacteria bacterium]HRY40958.1 hypothetical protein [Candidatus Krumholzibacteria bacterium]
MREILRCLALVALATAVSLALAAEPEPQLPAAPPARENPSAAPDLDVNQAEIEAGVALDPLKAESGAVGADAASPMIAEIEAVLAASRAAVAELSARAATADPATAHALQEQIAGLKQQAELDILGIQVRHARAAGDVELAARIEADIAAILDPPAPTAPAEPRPAPAEQN